MFREIVLLALLSSRYSFGKVRPTYSSARPTGRLGLSREGCPSHSSSWRSYPPPQPDKSFVGLRRLITAITWLKNEYLRRKRPDTLPGRALRHVACRCRAIQFASSPDSSTASLGL